MGCTSSSLTMTYLPSAVIPVTILRIVRSSFAYWAAAPSVFPLPADLVQPHRVLEALQCNLAGVGEEEPFALGQFPDDVRGQDFAALGQRRDAGRPYHRGTEQVSAPAGGVLRDGLACVQPDADADGLGANASTRSPFDPSTLLRVRVSGMRS